MAKQAHAAQAAEHYVRFPVAQRIEHLLLILSFTTLALTGLVQKFSLSPISQTLIALMGGIETVRIIHRAAAILFALETIYHAIVLAHKVFVQRVEMTMLPGVKDVLDALDVVRFNLGLTKEHPKLPRYNFAEKVEYWALIWGGVVMGLTGFMLWNPIITSKILPGQIIPAAKAAHGGEAILAVLAILIWHFYSVHVKTFNKSMFTGKMTRQQMEEEHGEELERALSGRLRPPADPEGVRRRERVFIPIAIVSALVMMLGIYLAVTIEDTAVSAAPPPPTGVPVFAPLTPTPAPSATVDNASIGPAIPHPVQGQEQCDRCHAPGGMKPWPADHEGRPVESCLLCHKEGPAAAGGAAAGKPIPHPIEGDAYKNCTTCHGIGTAMAFPENHASFSSDSCTMCHKPAAEGATPEPGGGGGAAAGKPIPHPIEGDAYKNCTTCHGIGTAMAFPKNHASFAADSCTMCHQPAESGEAGPAASGAKAIPHAIEGEIFGDCNFCHGPDKMKPAPASHEGYPGDGCTACHQPAIR